MQQLPLSVFHSPVSTPRFPLPGFHSPVSTPRFPLFSFPIPLSSLLVPKFSTFQVSVSISISSYNVSDSISIFLLCLVSWFPMRTFTCEIIFVEQYRKCTFRPSFRIYVSCFSQISSSVLLSTLFFSHHYFLHPFPPHFPSHTHMFSPRTHQHLHHPAFSGTFTPKPTPTPAPAPAPTAPTSTCTDTSPHLSPESLLWPPNMVQETLGLEVLQHSTTQKSTRCARSCKLGHQPRECSEGSQENRHDKKSERWTWGFGEDTKRFIATEGQKEPRPSFLGASWTFVTPDPGEVLWDASAQEGLIG